METQTDLREAGLSTRAKNCLVKLGVSTLEEVSKFTPFELLKEEGLGKHTFKEIQLAMSEKGLSFDIKYPPARPSELEKAKDEITRLRRMIVRWHKFRDAGTALDLEARRVLAVKEV